MVGGRLPGVARSSNRLRSPAASHRLTWIWPLEPSQRGSGASDTASAAPSIAPRAEPEPSEPSAAVVGRGPVAPIDVVGDVVSAAVAQVGRIVRPEAAVAVAAEFTFPLALAVAVLLFLVVQDQVDRRDPKLRVAPRHVEDTLIRFQAEDQP